MFAAKDCRQQNDAVARVSVNLTAPARITSSLRQESQTPPFVFSKLRTLLLAQKFQRPYFHSLPHSLKNERNITPAFTIAPALFLRSCASEPRTTPVFSSACALFHKTTGDR